MIQKRNNPIDLGFPPFGDKPQRDPDAPALGMMPRSDGTKIVLFPSAGNTGPEFSIGIENGAMWFNTLAAINTFKFYMASAQKYVFDQNNLTLPAAPTANMHAATKQYVDQNSGSTAGNWVNLSIGAGTNEWGSAAPRARTMLGGAFAHYTNRAAPKDSAIAANTWRNRFTVSMPANLRPSQNLWVPVRVETGLPTQTFAEITVAGDVNIFTYTTIPVGTGITLNYDYATSIGSP